MEEEKTQEEMKEELYAAVRAAGGDGMVERVTSAFRSLTSREVGSLVVAKAGGDAHAIKYIVSRAIEAHQMGKTHVEVVPTDWRRAAEL